MRLAQGDRLPRDLPQLALQGLQAIPGDGVAAGRLVAAGQAQLVAVVDARRAGQRHLAQRRQPERTGVFPGHGQEARRVVAAQQIKLGLHDLPVVERDRFLDLAGEAFRVQRHDLIRPVMQAAERLPPEVADGRAGEQVVHHRVELVAGQPAPGREPDLADDVRLRVGGLDPSPELPPELVVVDLLRHVQPPAVRAEAHPVLRHTPDKLAHGGRPGVELGQGGQVPPGRVIGLADAVGFDREVVEGEPVQVGGMLPALQGHVELEEAATGVVEHAVNHDADAARVGGVQQGAERLIPAQQRIDMTVIMGVVAVVGG